MSRANLMIQRRIRRLEEQAGIRRAGRCPTCVGVLDRPDHMRIIVSEGKVPPRYTCPDCGWTQREGFRVIPAALPPGYGQSNSDSALRAETEDSEDFPTDLENEQTEAEPVEDEEETEAQEQEAAPTEHAPGLGAACNCAWCVDYKANGKRYEREMVQRLNRGRGL